MIINGKERKFEFTVGAADDVSELCPGKDIANFSKIYEGRNKVKVDKKLALILNHAAEDHLHYEDPDHTPDYLTDDDLNFMSFWDLDKLEAELTAAMAAGVKTAVKTEPIPAIKGAKNAPGTDESV